MQKKLTKLLLSFFGLLAISQVNAQTFDSFKKQRQQDYEEFKEQRQKSFQDFVEEREARLKKLDKQFTRFLKQHWKDYEAFKSRETPKKPGPKDVPEYKQEVPEKLPTQPVETVPPSAPSPKPADLPVLKTSGMAQPDKRDEDLKTLQFFGTPVRYNYSKGVRPELPGKIRQEAIVQEWQRIIETDYHDILSRLIRVKNRLNLNDWGYFMLVKQLSNEICESNNKNAVFLRWFLLTKSQYDSRLGFKGEKLRLLLPFQQTIYDTRYFKIGNRQYYMLNGNEKNLNIYRKNYAAANQIMDLNIYQSPNLVQKTDTTVKTFKGQKLRFRYNQNLMRYYDQYPRASMPVYFNAATGTEFQTSVRENFDTLLADKTQQEAVSLLLDFVQALPYKRDNKQFGKEKFFFPAEVFNYPFSDCEDRSVLFSYLVRELLGLKVLGVEYPKHIATAVHFEEMDEYSFEFNGEPYVVCDPTYKSAPMGMIMPRYQDDQARVLALENREQKQKRAKKLWKQLNEAGIHKGANQDNVAFSEAGKAYLTGYYTGDIGFNGQELRAGKAERNAVVVCYNADNEVNWVKDFGGKGDDMGYHVYKPESKEGVLLAGMFSDTFSLGDKDFSATKEPDMFLAHIDEANHVQWVNRAGLSHIGTDENANFAACFTDSGSHVWTRFYNQSEAFRNHGISMNAGGQIFVKGGLQQNTGLRTKKLASGGPGQFNAVSALKEESDKLKRNNYHPAVTGLFAVMELIKNAGVIVEGAEVQKALDKYNPEFQNDNSTIYKNIGKIRFLKNADGVVEIQTHNGSAVSFSNMEISDGARVKITRYQSGNAKIEVLSGIEVGKAIVWYDLNSIKLFQEKPNLVFDYSDDHSKKTVSMKDIVD